MNVIKFIIIYFAILNIVAYLAFFIDKRRSIRAKWRIPEATLMSLALFGGSIGCLLGMKICHHKTQKPLFYIGVPTIFILQILLFIYLRFFSPFIFTIQ